LKGMRKMKYLRTGPTITERPLAGGLSIEDVEKRKGRIVRAGWKTTFQCANLTGTQKMCADSGNQGVDRGGRQKA